MEQLGFKICQTTFSKIVRGSFMDSIKKQFQFWERTRLTTTTIISKNFLENCQGIDRFFISKVLKTLQTILKSPSNVKNCPVILKLIFKSNQMGFQVVIHFHRILRQGYPSPQKIFSVKKLFYDQNLQSYLLHSSSIKIDFFVRDCSECFLRDFT